MAAYRWILNNGSVNRLCHPVWKNSLTKDYAFEQNQIFRRASLSEAIIFVGADYDWLMAASFTQKITVKLQISWAEDGTYEDYFDGMFYRTDCTINVDDKTIKVKPEVDDRYTKILAGLEKEYDLIKLRPAINFVNMKRRPLLQIYSGGENIVSCFLSGMAWEQEVMDNNYSDSQLRDDFHFGVIGSFIEVSFSNAPTGLTDSMFGTWEHGDNQGEWPDFSNEQNTYYMTYFQYKTLTASYDWSYKNGLRIYAIGTTTPILWQFEQTVYSTGGWNDYKPIPDTFTMAGQGGRSDLSASWSGTNIYGRWLVAYKPNGAYDIPSSDIVTYNRNYRYCIPYSVTGVVRMTNRSSTVPTEWGLRPDGKYYMKPQLTQDEQTNILGQYPIGRSGWGTSSIWLQWSSSLDMTSQNLTKAMQLRDAYTLKNVINALLSQIDPTITFDESADYSVFLYGTNPVYPNFGRLLMTPKSNLMVAEYSQPAQKAPITLADVLNMLKNALGCYWYVDGSNRLRIEHISYYKNGDSYSGTPSVGIDMTTLLDSRNGKTWVRGTGEYSYDKLDMTERYEYSWMDETTDPFKGSAIEVLSPFVQQGKIEEVTIALYNPDVDYIMLNPSDVSEDGFALMCCLKLGNAYHCQTAEVQINDDTRVVVQNPKLAMINLQPNVLISDMPAWSIKVNGTARTALGIQRKMKQQVSLPCIGNADPITDQLVKTSIGNGWINQASINLTSRMTKFTLVYDTTQQ